MPVVENEQNAPLSTIAQDLRILGTAEDRSGVRGVLFADIFGVADLDAAKAVSYQWLADDNVISGATQQTLDVGDYFSVLENTSITVSIIYTDISGSEATATSAAMPYEGFRIVANAEPGRNEWSGVTASEEVANSVNPYPFVESYSNNGTSSTDGTSAGPAHNITSVKASDEGIVAREGDYVIQVYADGSKSNRSELAHLNNETSFKEGEDYYFSGSFYAPSTEWDPVTEGGSTVITQLKQYGGGDPNFELRLSNNGDYKMTWRAIPHELSGYQEMGYAIPDAWNDLKIYAKHSQGPDGIFQVWLNGEQVIDYIGSTMYRDAEGYLKFGMYTQIHDERVIYWDAIEISDHLTKDFDTWLNSGANLPSINVTGISNNQQYESAADIVIGGTANDPAGEKLGSIGGIQKVELFESNTSLGSTTNSSFSFNNLSLSDGSHTLRLVATDTDGNTAETTYDIWIGNRPPEVLINSENYLLGLSNPNEKMSLIATVVDPDGSAVDVKFLANGNVIGNAVKGIDDQYTLDWTPTTNGAYSIQVQATDNQGSVSLSDSKALLVGSSITNTTLTAIQDVTIEQNSSLTGNWSQTAIYGSTSSPRIALVEFNLSTIGDAKYIQSAIFQPYVTKLQNQPGSFSIYETEAKAWDQTSVTWDTRPLKGNLLDNVTIDTIDGYASFDVTKALQNAADADLSTVTFWIEDSEQEQQRFDFASENNSLNVPAKLVVSSSTTALPQVVDGTSSVVSTPDTTSPSLISASTSSDGSKVILDYDEALSANNAPAANFDVTVGVSTASISGVSTSGSTVELTLDTAIAHGQSVSVDYTDPTSSDDPNATQDTLGNDAISLSGVAVTNNVSAPDTTAPTFKSAATSSDGNKIILDYDEVLSSNAAAASDFVVTVGGSGVTISSVAASSSTVELTLASTIKAGEAVSVAYTDPTSGNDANAVQDEAGNDVATLSSTVVTNNSTAGTTRLFAIQDASIKENTNTNGDWSKNEVYGGGTAVVALVEFDLSSFSQGDGVKSATFSPYVRTLKNNSSSDFSIYSTSPKAWSQDSVIWSSRPLKDELLDTIQITQTGSYVDFDVTTAVQEAINNGQSKVTFWIEDSESEYQGFEFDSVNNNPDYPNEPQLNIVVGEFISAPDTTAPTFKSAATSSDGNKIILDYDEVLSSNAAAASDFVVTVGGSGVTISSVAASSSTVELTLASTIKAGEAVSVAYTDPTSGNDANAVQDEAGNDAITLSDVAVTNVVEEFNITDTSGSQSFTDVNGLQIVGTTVNDKDWDQHVGGGHIRADLSQLNDRDPSVAITFQWYADDLAISGATTSDLILEDYNISPEAIYLLASYSTLSGEQVTVTSPTLEQGDWRIFSGGEDGNIAGSNPAPFMETYSFSNSSRTHNGDGWYEGRILASDTHSISSVVAAEVGLSAIEGDSIIRIAATDGSKRAELGNRNWNTRLQENQDLYFAESLYLPKEEWDVVTQYSTLIFQHKQYPGADPNFEVRLSNEGDYKLFVQSPYGHYGLTGEKHNDHTIATLSPDTWHDLKIHLTPSQDDTLGQVTIYLDGETIFSEIGTNLNDRDNTNDSFLKLGMYTNIEDSRHYYVDAVEMSTFLPSTVSDWVTGDRQVSNTITDTSGSDLLVGTAQADNISVGEGADLVRAEAGNDTITLQSSDTWNSFYRAWNVETNDRQALDGKTKYSTVIDAGDDADTLILSNSSAGDAFFLHDSYSGLHNSLTAIDDGFGRTTVARALNLETIKAGDGNDIIDLTSPTFDMGGIALTLEGEDGDDILWAAEGDDTLSGGAGNDVLFGGEGNDTLIGGADADVFEFVSSTNTQTDTISDYSSDDRLKFYLASGQSELDHSNISNGDLVWNNLTIDLAGMDVTSLDQLSIVYDFI